MKYLFLDRDGVLNHRIPGDYVRNATQWQWLEGSKEAFVLLAQHFDRIFLVSNQQGVGKGLFLEADLQQLSDFFVAEIVDVGGKIDKCYYCTHLKSANCDCRKPHIGMALQAKNDFPEIDFSQSVLLGDSLSDMEMGKSAGMKTVFIATEKLPESWEYVDSVYPSLWEFALGFCLLDI